jgi:hypothetical protein
MTKRACISFTSAWGFKLQYLSSKSPCLWGPPSKNALIGALVTGSWALVAGLLARSQYPEGPAIGHLGTGFSWFPCLKANAEMVSKTPSCYCILLM